MGAGPTLVGPSLRGEDPVDTPISPDELVAFLIRARLATLGAREGGERELAYGEDGLAYTDAAVGDLWFAGRETIYRQDVPIWAMCYAGGVTADFVAAADVFPFLWRALGQVTPERPLRGPYILREGHHLYVNESQGTIERFQGQEAISFRNQAVYQLRYMGGVLR
jgi:hypothetical protein